MDAVIAEAERELERWDSNREIVVVVRGCEKRKRFGKMRPGSGIYRIYSPEDGRSDDRQDMDVMLLLGLICPEVGISKWYSTSLTRVCG